MKRAALTIVFCMMLAANLGRGQESFCFTDPQGDDYGPGTYVYPKNRAFEPYHGLFDLLALEVSGDGELVHFDLSLADLRNTWRAPEGFSHQVIEVYISRGRGGLTEPLAPGSFVLFSSSYPWDVMFKAAPWDSSELVLLGEDGRPVKHPLRVGVTDRGAIRASVPTGLIGEPSPAWRYYVLVGSYDGFGEDNFRPVMVEPGEWHLGGGRDDAWDPNVLDILAPARGRYSQVRQLGGFDPERKERAVLMPMGPGFTPGVGGFPWAVLFVPAVILAGAAWWSWYAPAGWQERIRAGGRRLAELGRKAIGR